MDRASLTKALVVLGVLIALSFILTVVSAFFIAVLLAVVLIGIDCKIPYIAALSLLLISSLFLVLNSNSAAEFFSVWSFYFLTIGILAQFRDAVGLEVFADAQDNGPPSSRDWK